MASPRHRTYDSTETAFILEGEVVVTPQGEGERALVDLVCRGILTSPEREIRRLPSSSSTSLPAVRRQPGDAVQG